MKLAMHLTKALLVIFLLGLLAASVNIPSGKANNESIQIIQDIAPGSNSSYPTNFIKLKSSSFFIADDGFDGFNPWITDGTPDGTHMIKMISNGARQKLDISDYRLVAATDDAVFFSIASNMGYIDPQLWKTDGTEAGTFLVGDTPEMLQRRSISGMQARGNDMFIFQGGDPARLYVYSKGRLIFLNIWDDRSADPLGVIYLGGMTVLGDNVYFLIYRSSNSSNELWRSDGSVDGTIKVASFIQTTLSIPIGPLVSTDKLLFFRAYGQIYQSTGAMGNLELIDGNYIMHPYRGAFVATESAVYFVSGGLNPSDETDLYMTTGKEGGIQKLINNVYEYLIPINGHVYFYSYDSLTRTFIGRSDGTQAGTEICKPISGSYSALFYEVVEVGGKVYFLGRNPENSTEIWTSDNIQAGCQPIASQYPGAQKDSSRAFTRAWLSRTGSHLLFVGNNGLSGFELMGYKVLQNDIFLPRIGR